MNFEIKRNLQFTQLIKAEGRLREFNFTRLTGMMEGIFSLDVADDRGNRIIFNLKQCENGWKLIEDNLPYWITESEPQIQKHIEEKLSEYALLNQQKQHVDHQSL
jgi:hypothetical protein